MNNDIRAAIAKIEVVQDDKEVSRGTGTLVGADLVLTALHVVANRKSETLDLYPGTINLTFPGHTTQASVYETFYDASGDWVLLKCEDPPPVRPVPVGSLGRDGGPWETFGFPDANPRDGMAQSGTVKMRDAELVGSPAYQLYSDEAAAGEGAPVKGLSGAPVLVDDIVVGVLRFALMKDQKTVAGTVYACPVATVARRATFLDLQPVVGGRQTIQTIQGIQKILSDQLRKRTLQVAAAAVAVVAVVLTGVLDPFNIFDRLPANSVAVLPFENLAGSAPPVLVKGLAGDITDNLAGFEGMRVAAPQTAAQFGGEYSVPYSEASRALRVANVVTGSVAAADDIIRVTAQMSGPPDGSLVWRDVFDVGADFSVFEVMDSVAFAVAEGLRVVVSPAERQRIELDGTRDTLAWAFYNRGNSLVAAQNNANSILGAVGQYRLAIDNDPGFAEAYAMLSQAHSLLFFGDWDASPRRDSLSRVAADSALVLGADSSDGYRALGLYHYRVRSDYDSALAAIDNAWAFAPADSDLLATRGGIQRRAGRWAAAASSMDSAFAADQGSSSKAYTAGQTKLFMRRFEDAEDYFERAVAATNASHIATLGRAGSYMAANRPQDAVGAIHTWLASQRYRSDTTAMLHGLIIDEFRPLIRILDDSLLDLLEGSSLAEAAQDTAFFYLARMEVFRLRSQADSVRANADSLLAVTTRRLSLRPGQASYQLDSALALVGLDRFDEAIDAGRRATDLVPDSIDAYRGMMIRWYLTEIFVRAGNLEDAVTLVRQQLSVPGYLSIGWMRADPLYQPLVQRDDFASITQSTF